MENASKALLIAGGVFLAIMVLSIGVYMYGTFNKSASSYVAKLDAVELQKYNNPYEILQYRNDITAQEIISVVGDSQQKEGNIKVTVYDIDGSTLLYDEMQKADSEELSRFLNSNILFSEESSKKLAYFSCTNIAHDTNGKVTAISFKKTGTEDETIIPSNGTEPGKDTINYTPPTNGEQTERPSTPGVTTDWENPANPVPNGNGKPCFLNGTNARNAYVNDPDGDSVYIKCIVEYMIFPESLKDYGSFKDEIKELAKNYSNLNWNNTKPVPNRKTCTFSPIKEKQNTQNNGCGGYNNKEVVTGYEYFAYQEVTERDWREDYSTTPFKSSVANTIFQCEWIVRVEYFARDNYHLNESDGGWVSSGAFYIISMCDGPVAVGDIIRKQVPSGEETVIQYNYDDKIFVDYGYEVPCPECGKYGEHEHIKPGAVPDVSVEPKMVWKNVTASEEDVKACKHGRTTPGPHYYWDEW